MPDNDEERRKAIAAAYSNTWRAKNLEVKRAYERAYYVKNRERLLENQRRSRPNDPEARAARADYMREYAKNNQEAIREHKRRYREKNRGKLREAHRRYIRDESGELNAAYKERRARKLVRHAMDLETMAGRPRPEVCDVCGGPPDPKKGMHFDHCHKHGNFRGWLCRECNLVLGYVHDNPSRLRKLIAYLERTSG